MAAKKNIENQDLDLTTGSPMVRDRAVRRAARDTEEGEFRPPQLNRRAASGKLNVVSFSERVEQMQPMQRMPRLSQENRAVPTSGLEVRAKRSDRVSEISRRLSEHGFSCFDVWPVHGEMSDIEVHGEIAVSLNVIAQLADPSSEELTVVVLRLSSRRYLAWVREGSHGLFSIFDVANERRFHAIVERTQMTSI